MMKTRILPAILALSLTLPGVAMASSDAEVPAETQAAIRTMLAEQGYEVRQIQTEDGLFEAYALKDGKRYEIYINGQMEIGDTKLDD